MTCSGSPDLLQVRRKIEENAEIVENRSKRNRTGRVEEYRPLRLSAGNVETRAT
jgi:hypothetical protein